MPVNQQPHGIGSYIKKINKEYQNQYNTTENIINLGDTEATVEIENSTAGGSKPEAFVSSNANRWHTYFESTEPFATSFLGDGTGQLTNAKRGMKLETGTESGDYARLWKNPRYTAHDWPNYDRGEKVTLAVAWPWGTDNMTSYIGRGWIDNANKGYGFKVATPNTTPKLFGVVNDGSTEYTAELISDPSSYGQQLTAEVDPTVPETRFYAWDGDAELATLTATIPQVPTGGDNVLIDAKVQANSASSRQIELCEWDWVCFDPSTLGTHPANG